LTWLKILTNQCSEETTHRERESLLRDLSTLLGYAAAGTAVALLGTYLYTEATKKFKPAPKTPPPTPAVS